MEVHVTDMVFLPGHCPMDYRKVMEYAIPPLTYMTQGAELLSDTATGTILHDRQLPCRYGLSAHWQSRNIKVHVSALMLKVLSNKDS
jgi:hypothetical protein